MPSNPTYISTAEAVARLNEAGLSVTQRQVQRWAQKDQLEHTTLPNGRIQILASAVDALIPAAVPAS